MTFEQIRAIHKQMICEERLAEAHTWIDKAFAAAQEGNLHGITFCTEEAGYLVESAAEWRQDADYLYPIRWTIPAGARV